VLQANAAGEGYFPIHLNPVAGGVLIGNGNTMSTNYTLQVGGNSYFGGTLSLGGSNPLMKTNWFWLTDNGSTLDFSSYDQTTQNKIFT
ncbi:hypothetical protein ABTN46_19540, partial [Acinetobacter baumannii]